MLSAVINDVMASSINVAMTVLADSAGGYGKVHLLIGAAVRGLVYFVLSWIVPCRNSGCRIHFKRFEPSMLLWSGRKVGDVGTHSAAIRLISLMHRWLLSMGEPDVDGEDYARPRRVHAGGRLR